ncbi:MULTISPECIES: NADPH-dependent F420 reductase [Gammaproteobacteria]|uniref:NADPH-dependent F420 reductase n=1 Tax=Gammaproteobacteria TaxID=1236 RepID=UPI001125B546|nr:NADPH-dependent F420 reductase [Pseudomonas sp. Hp2]
MNILILGAGNMGSAFARQFTQAGHRVRIVARDLEKAATVAAANAPATAVALADSAADSDVIIVATPYEQAVTALHAAGSLEGKVIVDITNPLTADYMGLTLGHATSAAEEIAKALPGAQIVKAFNTVLAQVLAEGPAFANGQTVPVFYAGDDERAKQTVRALAESIGFQPIDAGSLKNARYLEPVGGLNVYFAYGAGQGTQIAPTWIHRN